MNVVFPAGKEAVNGETMGVNFLALADERPVTCMVSSEALQDISGVTLAASGLTQFRTFRSTFEKIARKKIEAAPKAHSISISSSDVVDEN